MPRTAHPPIFTWEGIARAETNALANPVQTNQLPEIAGLTPEEMARFNTHVRALREEQIHARQEAEHLAATRRLEALGVEANAFIPQPQAPGQTLDDILQHINLTPVGDAFEAAMGPEPDEDEEEDMPNEEDEMPERYEQSPSEAELMLANSQSEGYRAAIDNFEGNGGYAPCPRTDNEIMNPAYCVTKFDEKKREEYIKGWRKGEESIKQHLQYKKHPTPSKPKALPLP